ncbi:MAG: universal stress protein [Burkholderiaceae bacterium]|nr:universal stress protein [Burkholderiaceae bacterium]
MYKRILLAYDGSAPGQQALLASHDIAQWSHARLTLIAVMALPLTTLGHESGVFNPTLLESEENRYKTILESGLHQLAQAGLNASGEVLTGDAVHEICRHAKKIEADLFVVGHRHQDGWAARWWHSSVSPSLIELAPCSVLVVVTR